MTNLLLIPLEGGFGHHGPPPFAPFIGGTMFLLFLLFLAGTFFLLRRGGARPPWLNSGGRPWGSPSPEGEAKKILAERFARGDISTEEFMERASVLNWTPGAEPLGDYKAHGKKKNR